MCMSCIGCGGQKKEKRCIRVTQCSCSYSFLPMSHNPPSFLKEYIYERFWIFVFIWSRGGGWGYSWRRRWRWWAWWRWEADRAGTTACNSNWRSDFEQITLVFVSDSVISTPLSSEARSGATVVLAFCSHSDALAWVLFLPWMLLHLGGLVLLFHLGRLVLLLDLSRLDLLLHLVGLDLLFRLHLVGLDLLLRLHLVGLVFLLHLVGLDLLLHFFAFCLGGG